MSTHATPSSSSGRAGGSGFVGGHVVLQLLDAGYSARTTVRSLDKVAVPVKRSEMDGGRQIRQAVSVCGL